MHRITREQQASVGFRYAFTDDDDPLIEIQPGETVVVESEDSYHGQVLREGRRNRSTEPRSNPLSGPIYVDGATPGDTLAVHIESIEPLDGRASTYVPSWWWFLGGVPLREAMDEFLESTHPDAGVSFSIENGTVSGGGLEMEYDPMLGTIGTAPRGPPAPNGPAGPHGGNMDLQCIKPGCTVYLPVSVTGANLSLGDAHAAQGEGEITGVAAEMAARTKLQIDVISGGNLAAPRVETDDALFAVAPRNHFASFEETIRLAYVLLVNWLCERGDEKWDAMRRCALSGRLVVGNTNCVAAGLDKSRLPYR
ncbi:acetamidase/formamidase family protein [Haladaptatus sp. DYSN1]|uniref:acetamidase/formamidase family protein n=3 Tax=Haladaptatus TaxID=367188 RepID=UPI00240513F1|nr:acetamidase/formamidase family protein [Haladaptatus sp. DYSN1]